MSRGGMFVATLFGLLSHQTRTDAADPEVQAALTQLRMTLERLKSVQYEADCKYHRISGDGASEEIVYQLEFAVQGPMFYSRMKSRNLATNDMLDTTHAYDGDRFQQLDEPSRILQVASAGVKRTPYFMLQPLTYPFNFAFTDASTLDYPTLLDPQIWDELAENAQLDRTTTMDGRVCSVLVIHKQGQGESVEASVFLDNDRGCFPVRVASSGSNYRSELTVDDVAAVAVDSGSAFVPIHFLEQTYDSTDKLRLSVEMSITAATLRVNEEIPLTRFRIPKSRARIYDDVDARITGTGRPVWLNKQQQSSSNLFRIVGGCTLFIFTIIITTMIARAFLRAGRAR